jgi:uncharacterized membrane protein YhaH (DUF805 family)
MFDLCFLISYMEPKQPQQQQRLNSVEKAPLSENIPHLLHEKPRPGYFSRLFSGRLNRQNYIIGSTFFVLVPLLCFMVVIFNILLNPNTFAMPYLNPNNLTDIITPQVSIVSLLETPTNEVWSTLGLIFFVFSFPYVFSLQIRRLHDLNLNGWFWIVNFGSLLPLYSMFSSETLAKPTAFFWISEIIGLIASLFSLYVSLWPGTKGPNRYGEPPLPRSSLLEIFCI